MRRYGRVDVNHREIVKGLRAAGCSVLSLANLGSNVPDLLVGRAGVTYLLELKRGDGLEANTLAKKLRLELQAEWRAKWRGGPAVEVRSVAEALAAAGVTGPRLDNGQPLLGVGVSIEPAPPKLNALLARLESRRKPFKDEVILIPKTLGHDTRGPSHAAYRGAAWVPDDPNAPPADVLFTVDGPIPNDFQHVAALIRDHAERANSPEVQAARRSRRKTKPAG